MTSSAPIAAILLNRPARGGAPERTSLVLAVFMRLVAALWLFEGLVQWSVVVVTNVDGRSALATLAVPAVIAVVFFAIINMVASVGLWLATPWGGVIWLVSAGAQLFVVATMPGFFDHPVLTGLVDLALVAAYLFLTWQVALAHERETSR